MSNETKQERKPKEATGNAIALLGPRLPYFPEPCAERGISGSVWQTLTDSIWPTASSVHGVLLAWDYCQARNLDPLKKPVHVVPIWDKTRGMMVDTIWPGIAELRTTAHRTGAYAGCDEAVFGDMKKMEFIAEDEDQRTGESTKRAVIVEFPEWCSMVVHKFVRDQVRAFPGPKVFWIETYATSGRFSDMPNEMWRDRPRGQLEKCAEAAALRRAFPEEIGGEYIPEEIERRAAKDTIEGEFSVVRTSDPPKQHVKPSVERPTRESVKEDAKKAEVKQEPKKEPEPKVDEKKPPAEKSSTEPEKPKEEPSKPVDEKRPAELDLKQEPKKDSVPEDHKSEVFKDWLKDQTKTLDKLTKVAEVDDLQERVEQELVDNPDLRKWWIDRCNARARALMKEKNAKK